MGTLHADYDIKRPKAQSKRLLDRCDYCGAAGALFSTTQQRLFALLFAQPERSFYARELIALTGAGSGSVQRELARLVESRLLNVFNIGNQKHYQANAQCPIYPEIRSLVMKSFGIADKLRGALLSLQSTIAFAFIYGSVARSETHAGSDIDIMIVADDLTLASVFAIMQPLELQLGRKINPTLFTCVEFKRRKESKQSFLTKVLASTIIPLIGDAHAAF